MNDSNKSSNESSSVPSPRRRVLEWRDLHFGQLPNASLCLKNSNVQLHSGELAIIRTNTSQNTRRFASMLQGLIRPDRGSVLFGGRDWSKQHIRTQLKMRSRIGRVFDGNGWIANLNIRENLYLAKQHHGSSVKEIETQLDFWAEWFQIGTITRKRPSQIELSQLQVFQWIRSFLGPPSLVILERPMRAISTIMREKFVASIEHLQSLGSTAVWIAGNTFDNIASNVKHDLYMDLRPRELVNDDDDDSKTNETTDPSDPIENGDPS